MCEKGSEDRQGLRVKKRQCQGMTEFKRPQILKCVPKSPGDLIKLQILTYNHTHQCFFHMHNLKIFNMKTQQNEERRSCIAKLKRSIAQKVKKGIKRKCVFSWHWKINTGSYGAGTLWLWKRWVKVAKLDENRHWGHLGQCSFCGQVMVWVSNSNQREWCHLSFLSL